jgi:hypothetical protein
MTRVPFFFEAWESHNHAELQMCRKTMRVLLKMKIAPLPFASSVKEMQDVLASLKSRGMSPGLFIINTYWAEELLLQIDPLMPEEVPALFFRRGLCADARARDLLSENPAYGNTSVALNKMMPRLASVWEYGKLTSDAVAEKAAQSAVRFLQDNNFKLIERATYARSASRMAS